MNKITLGSLNIFCTFSKHWVHKVKKMYAFAWISGIPDKFTNLPRNEKYFVSGNPWNSRHKTLYANLSEKKKTQKYHTAQTALVSMQNSHTHLGREWAQPVCEWTPSQTINLCVVANNVKGSIRVYEARPRVCHKTIGFIQRLRGAHVRHGKFLSPSVCDIFLYCICCSHKKKTNERHFLRYKWLLFSV